MSIDIESEKDDVLRKIGRNMLLFQNMEYMLKWIVSAKENSGYVSEFYENSQRRKELVHKQTLGQLVGQLAESNKISIDECVTDMDFKEPHISVSIQFELTDHQDWGQRLSLMVGERNELIHNLLPLLHPDSLETWQSVGTSLDEQRQRILAEIEVLNNLIKSIKDMATLHSGFMQSAEFPEIIKAMQTGEMALVDTLQKTARDLQRKDGWTLLSKAGQILAKECPNSLELAYMHHKCKSLKQLIEKLNLFEVKQEPTSSGQRALYRMKDDQASSAHVG